MIEGIEHVGELSEAAKLFAPMKLLTKEIRDKLPALYSQEEVEDPMVWVKFFTPDSNWTWYGTEFDGEDTFFGWVVGFEKELGYFSLKELQSVRGPLGLAIERDKWFKPMPLSEVKKLHAHERGELAQGTMGAIGTAAITGAGIAIGFKAIDWLARTFKEQGIVELANKRSSAGFPLDPREEKPEDIDRFYRWTDTAGRPEVLIELCERADSLGAHLCLAKEGDEVDREWLEKCPYIGTDEVYTELSRLRFLCWKLTETLPSSATILGKLGEGASTEHFCLSGDVWIALQDLIGKGEKQKAMELMWSKGMKLVSDSEQEELEAVAKALDNAEEI